LQDKDNDVVSTAKSLIMEERKSLSVVSGGPLNESMCSCGCMPVWRRRLLKEGFKVFLPLLF
jgi:hypothetical protein